MKIRIGKDLNLRWSILTNNEPTPLEGRNLNLLLQDPNRQQRVLSFTTEGNTIISYIPAADLTRLGEYILTLKENEGEEGQTVVDAKPAFTLVEYTTEESSEPTDTSLSVADITLSTANLAYGITIQDVFGGEDGGKIQGGDIVPVLRDGVLQRVEHGAYSAKKKKEPYRGIIHKAIPIHPQIGTAYIFRGNIPHISFILPNIESIQDYYDFFTKVSGNKIYEYNIILYYGYRDNKIKTVKYFNNNPTHSEVQEFINDEGIFFYTASICFYRGGYRFSHDFAFYINDENPISEKNKLLSVNENIKMASSLYRIHGNKVFFVAPPYFNHIATPYRNTLVYKFRGIARGLSFHRRLRLLYNSKLECIERNYSLLITRGESYKFRRKVIRYGWEFYERKPRGRSIVHFAGPVRNLLHVFSQLSGEKI